VFSKLTDANGKPIITDHFVSYVQDNPHFYNGPISTLPSVYAYCGPGKNRINCNGDGLTIGQEFADSTSGTTAMTVTPSYPFASFWQPTYTPPGPKGSGFGIGIDPSNNGVNIQNESDLFHEALHGITGEYENEILKALQISGISIYIDTNVLSQCPTFKK
jgi:hypothetical protein